MNESTPPVMSWVKILKENIRIIRRTAIYVPFIRVLVYNKLNPCLRLFHPNFTLYLPKPCRWSEKADTRRRGFPTLPIWACRVPPIARDLSTPRKAWRNRSRSGETPANESREERDMGGAWSVREDSMKRFTVRIPAREFDCWGIDCLGFLKSLSESQIRLHREVTGGVLFKGGCRFNIAWTCDVKIFLD